MSTFPVVFWENTQVQFLAPGAVFSLDQPISAALVFAFLGEQFVIADIQGRGWCIPGGHLHPGETPEQAARRETWEEIGATLGPLTPLGDYLFLNTETRKESRVPVYIAPVVTLGELPAGTESLGRYFMTLEEAPERYFRWDGLMEAVFQYAYAQAVTLWATADFTADGEKEIPA